MPRLTLIILVAALVPILSMQDAARPADLVLLDGQVLTVDDRFRTRHGAGGPRRHDSWRSDRTRTCAPTSATRPASSRVADAP